MVVVRCTRKLLERVGPPVPDPPSSTARLGDWYAKPVAVAQRRFVLLMSVPSLLTVVMPGRNVSSLMVDFPDALQEVLRAAGISSTAIEREVEAPRDAVPAATDSRSLLASLNDFASQMQWKLSSAREPDLVTLAMYLNGMPVGAMGYKVPADVARGLLD